MNKLSILLITGFITVLTWGCSKDPKPVTLNYTIPTTYNFPNFNDSNALKLLAMADQLGAAINLANTTPNTPVDAQKLTDMFNNVNNYFVDSSLKLNASGLRLADYCCPAAKTDLLNYFDR